MTSSFTRSTEYPIDASRAEQLRFLVGYAVLAPSGHNTQPWLFRAAQQHIDIIADRTRALRVVDPYDRELTMSCAASLDHMQVAAKNYGRELSIEIKPDTDDTDLLFRVGLGDAAVPDKLDRDLFEAIPNRITNRSKFDQRALPDDLAGRCVATAADFGVELDLIADQTKRSKVAALVAEGDRIQFADPRFRRELASCVHSRRKASRDGMSGSSFGMPDFLSSIGAFMIRTFDIGNGVGAEDQKKIVDGSPTLAVFSSQGDEFQDWIAIGRALSRASLTLTAEGALASYLNQPIEVDSLRPQLRDAVDCKGVPQLLLRFGFGTSPPRAVRRSVDEVLI